MQKTARKNTNIPEMRQFLKSPILKGYSLYKGRCKIVSLGQKLKMPKTCEKLFYKIIRVVLSKKTSGKNTKYSRNETILKIGHLAKAIAHEEAIDFEKWSVWVKT